MNLNLPNVTPDTDVIEEDGEQYVPIGLEGLLSASVKLKAMNQGLVPPDNRDSPEFKRFYPLDKLLRERIRLDTTKTRRRLAALASRRKSLQPAVPLMFDQEVKGQFIGNPLASPLEEINPMQLMEQWHRVTQMGPGGIGSEDAITSGMQQIHTKQFGFISPISGPESSKAGVDARLAHGVHIGSDGKLYQRFRNRRTGEYHWRPHDEAYETPVKLPD